MPGGWVLNSEISARRTTGELGGVYTAVGRVSSGDESPCSRGRGRRERRGFYRRGWGESRLQGVRWAERPPEPPALPSWAGPSGLRKPPLARSRASSALHERHRYQAYGTELFVPGRLQNSCRTFHFTCAPPLLTVLCSPPRPGSAAVTSSPPSYSHASLSPAATSLVAPPKPSDPGTRTSPHRGGGDRSRSGRGDAAER